MRAWIAGALLAALALPTTGAAAPPLFTFAQLSDSQPVTAADWDRFEQVLDAIAAAGSPGALLPERVEFVLFAGDLVDDPDSSAQWVQWVNTVDARLTTNGIPYRAVPGNHDQDASGTGFYEFYVGDSGVWDTSTAHLEGHNGLAVDTGWEGLRIIGFNNSNGGPNQISSSDRTLIASRVNAAASGNENALLLCHHPHDDVGPIPLASVLTNPTIVGYLRGHTGSPGARAGLAGITNPNVWDLNSSSILVEGAILYVEVYANELHVYTIELATPPAGLPAPDVIPLPHALSPVVQTPPTADFGAAPIAGPAPLAVSFSDFSSGGATGWSWSFGDGGTSSEQGPTHVYTAPGVYDVSLTASNALGSDTRTRAGLVTVAAPQPTTTFLATADARVNSGNPTANYGGDPVLRARAGSPSYRSYLRFDVTGVASQSVLSARLRVFTSDASRSGGSVYAVSGGWTEDGITWNDAPAIGGSPIATLGAVASGEWIEYDVTSRVRGDGSYDFGLATAETDSLYLSSREGAHPPQLVLQTGAVTPPVAGFGAAPRQGPAPLAVAFTDLSTGGPTSWLWSFGDGATSTARNPSHGYASPGVYDVTLQVTNGVGSDTLVRSAFVEVVVPAPPTAEFSATPLAGESPLAVAFLDLSTGAPTSWLWSFGDGGTSTLRNPTHTYVAPGSYDVRLTAANDSGSDVRLRGSYVAVSPGPPQQTILPAADARVSAANPTSNYGSDSLLRVRGGSSPYASYLRFDLGAIAGLDVLSAKLRLFATDGSSDGGTVWAVSPAWSEEQITWADAPPVEGAPVASVGAVADGQWVELDLGSAVPSGGSVAFALTSDSTNSAYYSSREGSNPPQLVVATGQAVAPQAAIGAEPREGAAPLEVAFSDFSTGGPTSWLWHFGDGSTSTEPSPRHTYAAPGSYDVTLEVANAEGADQTVEPGFVVVSPALPTRTFAAVADAKLSEVRPDVAYGTEPDLRVRSSGGGDWRGLLRFSVAGISKPVVRAALRLWVTDGSRDGGAVYAAPGAWAEDSVSWANAPAIGGTPLASLGRVETDTWVEIDLGGHVTGNGVYEFGLASEVSDSALYSSREGLHPPELVIETAP